MKWNYLKGSEKDFANVNDGCVLVVQCRSDGHIYYLGNEFNPTSIEQCGDIIIAQREPIATPKHLMIFGDPKSFIFAHDEATHAAKNKVTGEVVHTHIPGLINLSKFDFIARRQLTDVTESDLNECIGASEACQDFGAEPNWIESLLAGEVILKAINDLAEKKKSEVNERLVVIKYDKDELIASYLMSASGEENIKIGSLHLDGKEHIAPLGNKYMREIAPGVWVDVYAVLKAWNVTNPALQHLIKKALQPGDRGHKTIVQDMQDIIDSAIRAKELEIK